MKWFRRAIGLVIVAAAVAAVALALWPRSIVVEVATVGRGRLEVTVDDLGRTRVKDRYLISSPIAGHLARIEVHPGDEIEADQVLARIFPVESPLYDLRTRNELQARLALAQAGVAQARATTERARLAETYAADELASLRPLAGNGAVTPRDLARVEVEAASRKKERESAEFAARAAAHQVTLVEASLARLAPRGKPIEELVIQSPLAGRVLRVHHESEGVVGPGTPLLEVGDPRALEVVVDVLTADAASISPGASVTIESWGGESLAGRVRLVEPSAFTKLSALGVEEQRVAVLIDPDGGDRWQRLGDGWRVEARIRTWEADDVLIVPSSAVFRHQGRWAVYQVKDATAQLTPIEVGQRSGRSTQVLGGLGDGAKVIVHPSDRVSDGVTVESR